MAIKGGVELLELDSLVVMTSRYPHWIYFPEHATVRSVRKSAGDSAGLEVIRKQNRELNKYGIKVDLLSFKPPFDLKQHRKNFLAVNSNRPFLLLYEHTTNRYSWSGNFIDMRRKRNANIFFEDLEFMFEEIIIPFRKRYVTMNGKALIYMWASPVMKNFAPVLKKAKKKYPVAIIGGERPFRIPRKNDDIRRVKELAAVMPYMTRKDSYRTMSKEYRLAAREWRSFLNRAAPGTRLFATYVIAFDKRLVRDPSASPAPMYPTVKQAINHAKRIRSIVGGVFDGVVNVTSYDEYYEGAAIEQSLPPKEFDPRLPKGFLYRGRMNRLSGTKRLEVIRDYLSR